MKNPPHPGRGLGHDLDALGLDSGKAAEAMHVDATYLQGVLEETQPITPDLAVRLEKAVGSTARMWLALQAAYDISKIDTEKLDIARLWSNEAAE